MNLHEIPYLGSRELVRLVGTGVTEGKENGGTLVARRIQILPNGLELSTEIGRIHFYSGMDGLFDPNIISDIFG